MGWGARPTPQWLAVQEQMERALGLESLNLSAPGPERCICLLDSSSPPSVVPLGLSPLWAFLLFLLDAAPLTPLPSRGHPGNVCFLAWPSGSRPFLCVPWSADTPGNSTCFSSFQPPTPFPAEASSLRSLKWECLFFNLFLATLVSVVVCGLSLVAASVGYTLVVELRLLTAGPSPVVELGF